MDIESFGFILEYENKNIYCEVFMEEGPIVVFFNGKYECKVDMDDMPKWVQADGNHLPEPIVKEIGLQIEKKYR